MENIAVELIKYGNSLDKGQQQECAFSLANIINISVKENFTDVLDITKIILNVYNARNNDGTFCLKPISKPIYLEILKLEKTTLKRKNRNLIEKTNNIKEQI